MDKNIVFRVLAGIMLVAALIGCAATETRRNAGDFIVRAWGSNT